jgi:hypothetical protein
VATISTSRAAPVIAAMRLRGGNAGSVTKTTSCAESTPWCVPARGRGRRSVKTCHQGTQRLSCYSPACSAQTSRVA